MSPWTQDPRTATGFDLALTEIIANDRHLFVLEIGSELGAQVLTETPHQSAQTEDITLADAVIARTAANMGRTMAAGGVKSWPNAVSPVAIALWFAQHAFVPPWRMRATFRGRPRRVRAAGTPASPWTSRTFMVAV